MDRFESWRLRGDLLLSTHRPTITVRPREKSGNRPDPTRVCPVTRSACWPNDDSKDDKGRTAYRHRRYARCYERRARLSGELVNHWPRYFVHQTSVYTSTRHPLVCTNHYFFFFFLVFAFTFFLMSSSLPGTGLIFCRQMPMP